MSTIRRSFVTATLLVLAVAAAGCASREARFGKPLGYELVATERIGNSFVRYVYLQKFENHALRWVFGYYKPKDSWLTNAFKFDDQLDQLYEED